MRIVELGDNSMVIMKDSEDPPWGSVGNSYRAAKRWMCPLKVRSINDGKSALATSNWMTSSESIYSSGRLILYFQNDNVSFCFKVGDRVELDY